MNNAIQPGQHPDADQLSAFIEQALPAYEREGVLAHLAMCAECRAVVALALPEEDEAAAPVQVQQRRPWFRGWMVFVPAAAAVAALALFVLSVHRQNVMQQQAQLSPLPAAAPPAVPAPQLKAEPPMPEAEITGPANPHSLSEQDKTANGASGRADAIAPATLKPEANLPAAPQTAVVENESVQSLPAPGAESSFAPVASNSNGGQNQLSRQAGAPQSVFHGASIGGPVGTVNL